jgi:error-prone DNA polymerase
MAVFGIWQKQGEVRHLLAKRVLDLSQLFNALKLQARNFQ